MGRFRQSSATHPHIWKGHHRFEHWYRDNTIYFITSKVRDGVHAFMSEDAKSVFWDRFGYWSARNDFEPWIVTLMSNHYHIVGYLKTGTNLGTMMQKLHGSVAKLVNDLLPVRHVPFWRTKGNKDYFDGCLRDETQLRRTYRYVQNQAHRARLVTDWRRYPHTRAFIDLDEALRRAEQLRPFLPNVPYQRYDSPRST